MPLVHLKSRRLEYKFEISGKYTIIRGDSGVGKTQFYDLVDNMWGTPQAVQNISGVKIRTIPRYFSDFALSNYRGYILVVDENCSLFKEHELGRILRDSPNYFIFIARTMRLGYLPIHTDNIYHMRSSGKFHTLERIYKRFDITSITKIDTIITEDSKSGYLFIAELLSIFDLGNIIYEPAYGSESERQIKDAGASKVAKSLEYRISSGSRAIFVVYDTSAFGVYVDELLEVMNLHPDIIFYILDWESFENYILGSKVFNKHITLKDTDFTVESVEQYCTNMLMMLLDGYSKSSLASCFKRVRCKCNKQNICIYKKYCFEDLIYGELQLLYDYFLRG